VTPQLLILALVLGFHLGPAWALLLIVLAGLTRIFPTVVVLELLRHLLIHTLNKHRR
jgi:hypothetical protein